MIDTGIKGYAEVRVTPESTARTVGSGAVEVFATPMMIALVEKACSLSVKPFLEEGQETVGTMVNATHTAASPLGADIRCESVLTEIDRRRLVFKFTVHDNAGVIGEGTHERFIIDRDKFMAKAQARLQN